MNDLLNLVRPNILKLSPYSSARDEYTEKEGIFLDANENPYGELNRYPDPYQKALKKKLANKKSVRDENIFIGNGSDEVIDLAFRIFCEPGKDKVLSFSPSYGMYEVSAEINNIELIKLPLNENFQIDIKSAKTYLDNPNVKLIFICSPNNPTGNIIQTEDILEIMNSFSGIVIIDEAYVDFAQSESLIKFINQQRIIVSQTFSKAWGLAAARVGVAYANKEIIKLFNKVKPPYNVSKLNQKAALDALDNIDIYKNRLSDILNEKTKLITALDQLNIIKKIYPSDANFLLLEIENALDVFTELIKKQIIIRNRTGQVANCLRVTIGSEEENLRLINELKRINEKSIISR